MTALPLEHSVGRAARPAAARRPELRLVSTPVEHSLDLPRPALRFTRRFRLLRTFVVVFVLAASACAAHAWITAPGPLEADHSTVIRPGQTLSDVATEQMPGVPVSQAVDRLTRLNSLSSPEVPAGRTVLVPAA